MHPAFRLLLICITVLYFSCVDAQVSPIPVTGFNQDAIAESGPSSLATTTLQVDGASSNKVIYTNAFRTFAGIAGGGIPDNGLITSGGDDYQLAPYNGNNALYIYRNQTRSLSLVTPAPYSKLKMLGFSTEGATALDVTVQFSDGSATVYLLNYSLPDWFTGSANTVLQGFGRCSRVATAPWGEDAFPSSPNMYSFEITLNCNDKRKNVSDIFFSNFSTFPNNAPFPNTVILAVSGSAVDSPPVIVPTITPCTCSGPNGSISLAINGAGGPYNVVWNTNPVQTGSVATNLDPSPAPYHCNITDAAGCIYYYDGIVPLNASNPGSITPTATPSTICPGEPVTLSIAVNSGIFNLFGWH